MTTNACTECHGSGSIWKGVRFASINEPCPVCTIPDATISAPPECDCMELGAQVCSAYEAWCSEAQAADDWNALSQPERLTIVTENAARSLARTFGGLLAPEVLF